MNNNINNWPNYFYNLNNKLVDETSIKEALESLINLKLKNLEDNQVVLILFKLKQNPSKFRSITYLQKVMIKDFNLLPEFFNNCFINKPVNEYLNQKWDTIIFSYKIVESESIVAETNLIKNYDTDTDKANLFIFGEYKLPTTSDYNQWGEVIFKTNTTAIVTRLNSNLIYLIKIYFNKLEVDVRTKSYSMKRMCTFVDILDNENNLSTFTRSIGNRLYVFENGQYKYSKPKIEINL